MSLNARRPRRTVSASATMMLAVHDGEDLRWTKQTSRSSMKDLDKLMGNTL